MKLYKQKNSPYWYGRISVNGKDCWISSGSKNKSEAELIVRDKVALLKGNISTDELFKNLLKAFDHLSETDRDNKRQEYANILMSGKSSTLHIDIAWETWHESPMKRNPSAGTIKMYHSIWKRFRNWAKLQDLEYLHAVTADKAQDYCADLWKSQITGNTYNKHFRFLRSVFNVLSIKAGLINNPWADIPSMAIEKAGRKNLSPEQLQKVCSSAKGILRYLFGIGLYTGLRLGDAVSLEWSEIKFDLGIIERIASKTKRQGKVIQIPIHPVLLSLLDELKETSKSKKYLFPDERKEYQIRRSIISKRIQKHFESCGVKTTEESESKHRRIAIVRYGFHSLRHSFVSLCAANRVPQVAIMEMVGHGSPAMTALYSHAGDEQKVKAIAGLPAIDFDSDNTK
jgi:integrase